jgi:hypothetical protein
MATKQTIKINQGEAKRVVFTLRRGGSAFDVSGGTFAFAVKKAFDDSEYSIFKGDIKFDKTDGASGKVSFVLLPEDTNRLAVGKYKGQLRSELAAEDVDISDTIDFEVKATAFHLTTTTTTTTTA